MNKNKKNPFKTPSGYFASFEDRLMGKLSKPENSIPKDSAFKVPDNYFESFNKSLKGKLENEPKVIPLFPIKKIIAVAASIAAIVLIALNYNWSSSSELSFSDLANTDIEAYFENNDFELSPYEIAEVLPVTETEFSDMMSSPIEHENILDYLSNDTNDFEEFNLQENE
ncbi:hypothetical protein [Maribacter hydrothermalis]|uniref:Uncharacterized protein n=1 Tax=Maribacter hydrothermalis TaxID=1836467 RepID=A0A1B7Z7L9_9FLAO|nr:hypothetical protein [Maribacter hydrothermalis]APQ15903.1 hypothetical protein BTR34_00450 [Maribacter hydrothermalis]OBR38718.1 hypothetical protein A9200_03360 [Maribacter hydrothermalis]